MADLLIHLRAALSIADELGEVVAAARIDSAIEILEQHKREERKGQ